MGERGCYWRRGQEEDFIPGYRVKTVDTTGAGDSFFGAFVYRLLESGSLLMDLTQGSSSMNCTVRKPSRRLSHSEKGVQWK